MDRFIWLRIEIDNTGKGKGGFMSEQRVFAVKMSNPDLMAWLKCLAERFGNRTLKQIITEKSLTGIKRIERR